MNATTQLNVLRFAAVACLALTVTVSQAGTFTVIDGEGFESPSYTTTFNGTGQLEGQFADTDGGFGSQQWLQSPLAGTGTATVQTSVVASGNQAIEVNRAANSDDRWAAPVNGYPAERYICIEWDMLVEQSATAGFGPFFGVEAYDDDATMILRMGMLGVDAATGDVLYGDATAGLAETGTTVGFDEWNSYRIVLDFQEDEYYTYLNGTLLLMADFESTGADQFTDADIAAIAASGDAASLAATGTAYFDNYMVFETDTLNKVPEPASLAVALLGGCLVAATRRRVG